MSKEATVVTNWDSMPPEVFAEGEIYSTRVLAMKYRKMEEALLSISKNTCCDNCQEAALVAKKALAT